MAGKLAQLSGLVHEGPEQGACAFNLGMFESPFVKLNESVHH